jgi:hypothetical protein
MNNQQYSLGKSGFTWFIGVVEDRKDPEQLGRVRVRCFGFHTDNKELIPTETLPWASIIQPPNLPASYTCKEGDMVFGFFMDDVSAQLPMVLGVIPGKPSTKADKNKGFSDPNGKYPKRLNESTFSRLARGSKYPFSYVHETESGHTFELDDNGKGRIKLSHNNGTYVEFDTDGNQINIVKKNNTVKIANDNTVTVGGDCKIAVDGNMTLSVKGALNIKAASINMVSGGAVNMQGSSFGVDASSAINISSGAATKLKAGAILSMDGAMTTLGGGIVDVSGGLVNIQMGSPEAPDALDIPDFEADILASISDIPAVATGNTLDKLKSGLSNVLNTVQTVVDTVQDVKAVYSAAKSGDILGAISGLSQLDPSLGKALSPITETVDKIQDTVYKVQDTVNSALSVVNDVGYIVGKDLYPKTSFLAKASDTLYDVSNKLDRIHAPLYSLGDNTYNMYSASYKVEETRYAVDNVVTSVDNVINTYNSVMKPAKQIPTVSGRIGG